MKRSICIMVAGLFLGGCAQFSTTQTDTSIENENGTTRTISTKAKATTFWASKSALANWKASQTDKTQGASVGALTQSSDAGTNMTAMLEAVIGAAVKAAAEAIKP